MESSPSVPSDVFSEIDDFLPFQVDAALKIEKLYSSGSSSSDIHSSDSFVDTARSIKSWPMPPINSSPSKYSFISRTSVSTSQTQSMSVSHFSDSFPHGPVSASPAFSPKDQSSLGKPPTSPALDSWPNLSFSPHNSHSFLSLASDTQATLVAPHIETVQVSLLDDIEHGVRVTVSAEHCEQRCRTTGIGQVFFRSGHRILPLCRFTGSLWIDVNCGSAGISSLLSYLHVHSDVVVEGAGAVYPLKLPTLRIRVFVSSIRHGQAFVRLNFLQRISTADWDVTEKQAILVSECHVEAPATFRDIGRVILSFWDDYDHI
ncbi:uncharacterized protein EI90DRAFT_3059527 [Cantharellus anzutake]|uniref:uncharacterized protein n=1 Tax=Cantharellus anzutake TaxID=1750568 RepID=UPI001903DEFD|nr:uncharacterized protein EI90DRAFT_3059527 [Cantharellus anzutake]KAF8330855.1 hypothetical protein EI90DRAFT_3059527 [Cantharellus anzutake]